MSTPEASLRSYLSSRPDREPEQLRTKGELLSLEGAQLVPPRLSIVFLQALDVARRQSAHAWNRAPPSLARFWRDQVD